MKDNLSPLISIDVAGYRFALVFEHYNGLPGTYTILDFFKTENKLHAEDENGYKYEVPPCAILNPEDYLKITNIRFDSLLPSYQKIDTPHSRERANWTLLNLLSAYDMSNSSRPELLRTAKTFAVWLSEVGDDVLPAEILRLNLLQTIKREREFTIDEIEQLCTITEDLKQREDILVGAHLLLGNNVTAEAHFKKLEPTLQEAFKKYPIYHFWKKE